MVASLEERGIKHISTTVVEDGIEVQQARAGAGRRGPATRRRPLHGQAPGHLAREPTGAPPFLPAPQVFFHDPSGFMIEICNCDALPICPLRRQTDEARSPCALAASRDSMDSDSVCTDVLSLHAL